MFSKAVWALGLLTLLLSPTQGWARDWPEIVASGILNVGVRPSSQLVYRPTNPEKPGLTYEMVQDFADTHGLKLNLIEITSFSTYWAGESGTPEIYNKIDLAAEIFTINDERQKRVKLTPFIENVELFFAAKGSQISSYKDLIGKSIITYEAMSFYPLLIGELEERKLPYKKTYIATHSEETGSLNIPASFSMDENAVNLLILPKGTKTRATMSYQPVASKIVDVGINDSVAVLYRVFDAKQFKESLRPLFPAQKNRSELAWGSAYETPKLNQKIEAFFESERQSGRFSEKLEKYIGMSFKDYQLLISMFE